MHYDIVLEYSPEVRLILSAFLLNAEGKAEGKNGLVYYGNPVSDANAVRCNSEKINSGKDKQEILSVDVNSIPANIHKIVFIAAFKDGDNTPEQIRLAQSGVCSLFSGGLKEDPVHIFDLADVHFEGGAVFYEIVRSPDGWTDKVIAAGSKNTLNDFAGNYGIKTKKTAAVPPEKAKPPQENAVDENNRLTQLQKENKILKEQLQTESKRIDELQKKYDRLEKEYNNLLGQQLVNSKLLPELQMLFAESLQYHFSDTPLKDALEHGGDELAGAQNVSAVLEIIEELYDWWREYRTENTVRSPFWRPDSWSRFEHTFPNHPVTVKLQRFLK
ncbi:MAG: TerD family protein [Planctomycetaceae bacterium]|jgi:tellurium resistance protein TerD|nr:TerD family protein [Planctomycetaceae bacterium]